MKRYCCNVICGAPPRLREWDEMKLTDCSSTDSIHFRCYALAEITADSTEFKESNDKFERLTSDILENALNIDDAKEDKRLVKKLHEACGFEQVP